MPIQAVGKEEVFMRSSLSSDKRVRASLGRVSEPMISEDNNIDTTEHLARGKLAHAAALDASRLTLG